jgi:hypothetical protein
VYAANGARADCRTEDETQPVERVADRARFVGGLREFRDETTHFCLVDCTDAHVAELRNLALRIDS